MVAAHPLPVDDCTRLSLYIAIPAFPLSTPEPAVIDGGMQRAIAALHSAGLPADAPIVVVSYAQGTF